MLQFKYDVMHERGKIVGWVESPVKLFKDIKISKLIEISTVGREVTNLNNNITSYVKSPKANKIR